MINILLYLTYLLIAITVIAAIGGIIRGLLNDLKGSMPTIIGFGALVVVFLILYMISGAEPAANMAEKGVTVSQTKFADAGLKSFYLLAIGAFGLLVYNIIKNIIQGS